MDKQSLIEKVKLLEELEKRKCEESYYRFFVCAWSVLEPSIPLIDQPYIKYLCDEVQDACSHIINGEVSDIDLLIVNIPPSCSKSSIITKFLTPWLWIKNPSLRICNSSYSAVLANEHCTKSRDVIRSEWYQSKWSDKYEMKFDQNKTTQFANNKTGLRKATSTGGSVTGFHFHLFIQDDPLNPEQAASDVKLQTAINFNDSTIPSRILPGGFQIVVMQRLHEADTTGHVLGKGNKIIKHICMPAELSDNVKPIEAREYYRNGLLDEVRLSHTKLSTLKTDLGSYSYSGQYEQTPSPEGGGVIKKEWFEFCHLKEVPENLIKNMWVDGAYTKNTANDPSGFLIDAYDEQTKRMYIMHAHCAHMELPEALKFMAEYAELNGLGRKSRIFFEPKASGKSMKQMINKNTNYSAVEIKSVLISEGKEARIQTAAPKVEAGKVWLVKGSWNDAFIGQLTGFPVAKHDEHVDNLGYSCDHNFKVKKSFAPRKRN